MQGPAAALFVCALAAVIASVFLVLMGLADYFNGMEEPRFRYFPILFWSLPGLILSGLAAVIVVGSVKLRQFRSYPVVYTAAVLAMLPWSWHCLIGIPAGICALRLLYRPEVRAAFLANLRRRPDRAPPAGPVPRKALVLAGVRLGLPQQPAPEVGRPRRRRNPDADDGPEEPGMTVKPYDPTLKALVEADPGSWPALLGRPTGPTEVIDADVSTVSGAADKVLRVAADPPYLLHLEFVSGHDATALPRKLHVRNGLLEDRHELRVSAAPLFSCVPKPIPRS